METTFNPIYNLREWDGDFDVPEGTNVVLRGLFLKDPDAILFVEENAEIFFV